MFDARILLVMFIYALLQLVLEFWYLNLVLLSSLIKQNQKFKNINELLLLITGVADVKMILTPRLHQL